MFPLGKEAFRAFQFFMQYNYLNTPKIISFSFGCKGALVFCYGFFVILI
jgi:hypothetical protein